MTGTEMDLAQIRELARLLDEAGLTEIEVETNGARVRLARQPAPIAAAPSYAIPPALAGPAVSTPAPATDTAQFGQHPGTVASPMVGTVYVAPEPGAPPFVQVGDSVIEGETLLIIEAMKTMNPIPAPRSGRVARILITDTQPVEFGQPLLILE
jgi:acetyl-CoA carboxylase biotin carboxyl carrier protein